MNAIDGSVPHAFDLWGDSRGGSVEVRVVCSCVRASAQESTSFVKNESFGWVLFALFWKSVTDLLPLN